MVERVCDIDVFVPVYGDAVGEVEHAVTAIYSQLGDDTASSPLATEGSGRGKPLNAVICLIGYVDPPLPVDGNANRVIELAFFSRPLASPLGKEASV